MFTELNEGIEGFVQSAVVLPYFLSGIWTRGRVAFFIKVQVTECFFNFFQTEVCTSDKGFQLVVFGGWHGLGTCLFSAIGFGGVVGTHVALI